MKEAYIKFVKEYRKTGDPVKSALKAGSLERNAEADSQRWLAKQEVKDALAAPEEKSPRQPSTTRRRVTRKK